MANAHEYAKHEAQTMEQRISRLNRELSRKEKYPGEHKVITAAIAKIHRRAKRGW